MPELYSRSYALLIPSVVEGFQRQFLKRVFGVPAIGSDTIGNRDAIINRETGILVRLNDRENLADAMHKLASDPSLRNPWGRQLQGRKSLQSREPRAPLFQLWIQASKL